MTELWDLQAERMWLGAVWHSQGAVLDDTTVTADDIWHPAHQTLHNALCRLRSDGAPMDYASVSQALGDDLRGVGDALTAVVTSGAVPQSARWHANTLNKLTAHRRLVEAATRLHQAANGEREPDELAEFARAEIDRAIDTAGSGERRTWAEITTQSLTRWTQPIDDAIATGWTDLDMLLSGGGLRPGHLTVVGARPGVGKSLVATMLVGRTAAAGRGVYFASVEMSADELTDRIAAASTGVNLADLTNRTLTPDQLDQLQAGVDRIGPWPLDIDDHATSVNHIRAGARRWKKRPHGLGLVVIDYLQLLSNGAPTGTSRQQVVSEMSRALKLLAKELDVPVVLLSQLNRKSEERADKRPAISDLRESGAVEQDADEIILLHRNDEDPDLAGKIEYNLAKNRHGPTGSVHLRWQPYISRITDLPSHLRSA